MSTYSYKPRQNTSTYSQPGEAQPNHRGDQPQDFSQPQTGTIASASYNKPYTSQSYTPTASYNRTYQPSTTYQPKSGGTTPTGTTDYQNKYYRPGGGSQPTYTMGGYRQETPKSSGAGDFGGIKKEGGQDGDKKTQEEMETSLTLLRIEVNRLSIDLDDKKKELEELRRQSTGTGKNYPSGGNSLAEQEVKRLAEINRDLEKKVKELTQESGALKEKSKQVEGLELKNKQLEAEIKALKGGQDVTIAPRFADQERIRDLEIKLAAYEDICHYYRKRIDAYETAFTQHNINPLLIKLLADSPDKPQQKNLQGPMAIQGALIEQNKKFERMLAEREGEVQAFKKRNDELENLLSQSGVMKDSSWQLRKENDKLKEQVKYQQMRIDQLIDMLLHHDIDIVTGRQRAPSEIAQKHTGDNDRVIEEEEEYIGNGPHGGTEGGAHPKRRREMEKKSGRNDDDEPKHLDLLKKQFADALKEKLEKERQDANDEMDKLKKAHQDELDKARKKAQLDDKARENELQELKDRLNREHKAREDELQALKNKLLDEDKKRENELQELRKKLAQEERARKELERAMKDAEQKLRKEFEDAIREENQKNEKEKREYEDVIQRLKEDFDEFDKKMKELLKENDRLRALLAERERELAEKEKDIQKLHDMNYQLQLENEEIVAKAEVIEQEHEDLFDKRKKELEAYLKKLLDEEKEEFMRQVDEERRQYKDKFDEYDKIVDELEGRNEKLTEMLQEKFDEVELWKQKYAILDTNRTAEIEELKNELEKRGKLDAENQALRAQLLEKETAFVLFFIEIERLFSINQEYDEEVSKLRKKDDVLVEKYNEAVERLNNLDQLEIQVEKEKLDLRQIIADLNEQLAQLEEKLRNALDENKKLRSLHEERKKEIDNLKVRLNRDDGVEEFTKEDIRRRDLEMKELINKYEFQIGELNAKYGRLEIELRNKINENQRQAIILAERKKESEETRALVDQLKREVLQGRNLEAQLNLKTEQYNQALKELSEIQLERDHLQNELSEKNFETSKKVHQMLQHLIQAQAINEQTAEDLIHAHPSLGGTHPGEKPGIGITFKF